MKRISILIVLHVFVLTSWAQVWRPGLSLPALQKSRLSEVHELPNYLDNSLSPYFPPIMDQYGGSCAQAAGIHYLFTYEINRVLDRPVENKPENIFSYRQMWHFLNDGAGEGGFSTDGLEITKTAGCVTTKYFSYENIWYYRWVSGYEAYFDAMHYRTKEINYISLKTNEGIENLKRYMYDKNDGHQGGGIACFSISSHQWSEEDYYGPSNTGYKSIIKLKGSNGAHAMTLVGYDMDVEYDCNGDNVITDDERGAFILVNSWDTWWGSNGRSYIPFKYFLDSYDYFTEENPGLSEENARAICIETEYVNPSIVFDVNIVYSSRNDISFELGVSDGASSTRPDDNSMIYPSIVKHQGGDLPMSGNSAEAGKNFEVAFDCSAFKEKIDTMRAPCFFLIVNKRAVGKSGTGYMKGFSIYKYGKNNSDVTGKYSILLNESTGAITGRNTFKLPSKPWYKNIYGEWLNPIMTSANSISKERWMEKYKSYDISVRTADGRRSIINIDSYDSNTKRLKLNIVYYEED